MKRKGYSLKITVVLAMMTAISIILGKYLAIRGGDIMRFSLENMPIILSGIAFGPLAGVSVGVVADLVGCVLVGYTVNPLVTLGAAMIGLISGFIPLIMKKTPLSGLPVTVITVALSHLVGSIIIKTIGLYAYYTMPFGVLLLWRLLNYIIVGALDCSVVHILLNNKGVKKYISAMKEEKK